MKDPAALFYIDTWLSATAEMDSDVRGWYLNLILHQFDKKDLPNDVEKLAVLAGVKFSEFERFKQVLEQVLKQKFKQNEFGRLENAYAKTILQGREIFKDKRSKSGNVGVVVKLALSIGFKDSHIKRLKKELYEMDIEQIDKHKHKQVLEQVLKLYINGNENGDNNKYITPINFLKQKIEIDLEHLKMKSKLEESEFEHCLNQWSLKCEEAGFEYSDDEKDLKKLRAGFEKWINSWVKNLQKQPQQNKQGKSGVMDIMEIGRLAKNLIVEDGN